MTVLDTLEASSSTADIQEVKDVTAGRPPAECDRVLVVLFVHNISPLERL